jgi:hypothetical protein
MAGTAITHRTLSFIASLWDDNKSEVLFDFSYSHKIANIYLSILATIVPTIMKLSSLSIPPSTSSAYKKPSSAK